MEIKHSGARDPDGTPDGTEERLSRLEQRVGELERAADRQQRARRRGRLFVLCGIALYVLVFYWELTKLV